MIQHSVFFKLEVLLQAFFCVISVSQAMNIPNATLVSNATTRIFWDESFRDERSLCDCAKPSPALSIVGGTVAEEGLFPFAVFVEIKQVQKTVPKKYQTNSSFCSGTLVTDKHVLTAAHCVFNISLGEHKIILTIGVIDKYEKVKNISRITNRYVVHPLYNRTKLDNDIALIEFQKPVNLGDDLFHGIPIKTAILPSRYFEIKSGTWLTAVGWGLQKDGEKPRYLHYVDLPKATCRYIFPKNDGKLCAGGIADYGVCMGDSGGPLLLPASDNDNYVLVGIASHIKGYYCASEIPSVFTNVAKYADWIYKHTRNAFCAPCMFDIQTLQVD